MTLIHRYSNRKMYDRQRKCFIRYEDILTLVSANTQFIVRCMKTKLDITESIVNRAKAWQVMQEN